MLSMRISCLAFIIAITLTYAFSEKSASVYRVIPETTEQLQLLYNLSRNVKDVSFWKDPSSLNRAVDVMVTADQFKKFKNLMTLSSLSYSTEISDVQALLDNATVPQLRTARLRSLFVKNYYSRGGASKSPSDFGWDRFHNLEEIYSWLDSLQQAYPDKVTTIVGGRSYEGRSIKGVHIKSSQQTKPGVFIESGIHAREWIAHSTATYLIDQLLKRESEGMRWLADNFEWYIFPCVNPDGYAYTHIKPRNAKYRFWRKTRAPSGRLCFHGSYDCVTCTGADPNRNWGYQWGGPGSNTYDGCTETFAGRNAFSEIETESLARYITSVSKKLFAYISFHSYIEKLMFPYGHTKAHLDNYDEQYKVGREALDALYKRNGYEFGLGNIAEALGGPASGGSVDWVKATFKLPFVYVYELRGHSKNGKSYGFTPPPSEIKPNGQEVMDSLVALFQAAKRYYPNIETNYS